MALRYVWIAAAMIVLLTTAASAEELVGRWCRNDTGHIQEMTIVKLSETEAMLRSRFSDGGSREVPLIIAGGMYVQKESATQDHYAIPADTRDLHLLDNLGLIAVAKRLPDQPKLGDCLLE